jgi:butyrate kinase
LSAAGLVTPLYQRVLKAIAPRIDEAGMTLAVDLFASRGGRWEDVVAGDPGAIELLRSAVTGVRGDKRRAVAEIVARRWARSRG